MSGGQGEKREKPREEKVKERAGKTLLFFFCTGFSRRFPLIFRLLGFPVLTQPEVLLTGYQGNKTKPGKNNNLLNIQLAQVKPFLIK